MRKPPKFNPHPFTYHQEIELEITSLTNAGAGLGRVDGWVVFVPFALPGETVTARVFRNHKNYSEADLVSVLQSSPERVVPPCPLFGNCGGCQYQHLDYAAQLRWKQQQVAELLEHMAGLPNMLVDEPIPSPRQYGYRSKITPHFEKPQPGAPFPIGFLRFGRRFELIDVPHCELATGRINEALPVVRADVHRRASEFRKGATLLLRDSGTEVYNDPADIITEQVGPLMLQFPAGVFFQNNPFILPGLTSHVIDQAKAEGVRNLVDAYCGSGLFALCGASDFEHVRGVEISEASIEFAKKNADLNGITNCEFICADAAEIFQGLQLNGKETAVIIDPPRRGSDETFLNQLIEFAPARIVYVSCNPATQVRDLQPLIAAGYAVARIQPFDLFPQTKHLECVITLQLG